MRRGKTRQVPPLVRRLIEPRLFSINGKDVVLGACCKCGRSLSGSHLNKTGVRCYYEGAQYDQEGTFLYDARTERLYKAAVKAEKAIDGPTSGPCIEALLNIIEAAKEVCAQ